MKLSMSVQPLPFDAPTPPELRGRLEARISVSGFHFGKDVSLYAGPDNEFELSHIVAMLRRFADHLEN